MTIDTSLMSPDTIIRQHISKFNGGFNYRKCTIFNLHVGKLLVVDAGDVYGL